MTHDHETKSRLLAKIVRNVLARESFDSLADLTDALKFECSRLKIPYTPQDISQAFAMIESNKALVSDPTFGLERVRTGKESPREETIIGLAEASKIYAECKARCSSAAHRSDAPAPEHFPRLMRVS